LKLLGRRLADGAGRPDDTDLLRELLFRYEEFEGASYLRVADALARGIDPRIGVAVTSRTKSIDSLIEKLRRDPATSLARIRDVAGVRAVLGPRGDLTTQDAAVRVIQSIEGYEWTVVDRRMTPIRGYRAIHVIGRRDQMLVEVQVRTDLQNNWAQMYERLADIYGRELRYGKSPVRSSRWLHNALIVESPEDYAILAEELSLGVIADLETQQREYRWFCNAYRAGVLERAMIGDNTDQVRARIRELNTRVRAVNDVVGRLSEAFAQP
jgi:hypothetical protein